MRRTRASPDPAIAACPCLQALPAAIGDAPPTGNASGRALHFPELACFETHPEHPAVREAAVAWGKAVMLCCWMGHLTPWRPEWFANFAHPEHWPSSCPHGGCTIPDCKGNGVRYNPARRQYILVASHHKHSDNSSIRDKAPISYPFPSSLFIWMDVWCNFCWPILAAQVRGGRPGGGPGACSSLHVCVLSCCPWLAAGHHHPVLHLP